MSCLDSGQAWQPDEEWNPSSHCCHSRRIGARTRLETTDHMPRAACKIEFVERATTMLKPTYAVPNPQAAAVSDVKTTNPVAAARFCAMAIERMETMKELPSHIKCRARPLSV